MSDILAWEHDREALNRCVAHHLLEHFPEVVYRDPKTRKIVIDIGSVAYFKNDDEFYAYRQQQGDALPLWVRRSKDLHAFQKTLRYIVEFVRRIEVYASSRDLLDAYEKRIQAETNLP